MVSSAAAMEYGCHFEIHLAPDFYSDKLFNHPFNEKKSEDEPASSKICLEYEDEDELTATKKGDDHPEEEYIWSEYRTPEYQVWKAKLHADVDVGFR